MVAVIVVVDTQVVVDNQVLIRINSIIYNVGDIDIHIRHAGI